jgi:hypothetical protein
MLPDSYSLLYPGRFLKADMLKGMKVTLTIKNIDIEELVGEKNKAEPKVVVSFAERPFDYVLPKTNGFCLKRMFGNDPHLWIGKKITIYPTTTKFGREDVDCIRIWGSPDIAEDLEITVPQGRKKAWETVMHKVETKKAPAAAPASALPATLDPRIHVAFGILGWDTDTQKALAYLAANEALTPAQMLADLNRLIDEAA